MIGQPQSVTYSTGLSLSWLEAFSRFSSWDLVRILEKQTTQQTQEARMCTWPRMSEQFICDATRLLAHSERRRSSTILSLGGEYTGGEMRYEMKSNLQREGRGVTMFS